MITDTAKSVRVRQALLLLAGALALELLVTQGPCGSTGRR